ncbi:DegT/DnrJ/EryC1/StrS family aminotransferase [Exiguobacterium sp.]|uniref:DegT/DnrJ/EryC1/StrS family aminotransferase n=1 Tax=Exiguobacterium sp. TaxID=44751 RepID=UPI00263B9924|nr:DegT/DnrJ/EryC1/StrS family aminotransferase [Exiguobacterium sp.]MCC5891825.1 DegT/DnrJ/EryC1/StrS family aminotransferase [Exiguobacterium sp.]
MLHIADIQSTALPGPCQRPKPKLVSNVIAVTKSVMPTFEEYTAEIQDIWETRWLTNNGSKHQQLEASLQDYLRVKNVALFTNGHLALEAAIEALGLTGEVITTPFTFASTSHALIRKGLTPVYGDIRADDYTLDATKLERLITTKTSAILPVHVYGNVCDVEAIERIAKSHNLKVIYDAAHAFGVTVNGRGIGTYGDVSMFSFHATKVFHTIEGGALTFNDTELKGRFNRLKNFGITGPETVQEPGGNAKMNEFQAAMGICNLRHIDDVINRRRHVREMYDRLLESVKGVRLLSRQSGVETNHSYYPIVFTGTVNLRDHVHALLEREGIYSRKYFYPLVTDYTWNENRFASRATPVARHIAARVLTLPLYPELSDEDVHRICEVVTRGVTT